MALSYRLYDIAYMGYIKRSSLVNFRWETSISVFCAWVFDLFETEEQHIFLFFNIKIHKGRCQCGLEDTFTNRPKNIINYTFHRLQGYQSSVFELNIMYMSSFLRLLRESWVYAEQ